VAVRKPEVEKREGRRLYVDVPFAASHTHKSALSERTRRRRLHRK
jgi:hypothetical protein